MGEKAGSLSSGFSISICPIILLMDRLSFQPVSTIRFASFSHSCGKSQQLRVVMFINYRTVRAESSATVGLRGYASSETGGPARQISIRDRTLQYPNR
jgi:hypothetical protein